MGCEHYEPVNKTNKYHILAGSIPVTTTGSSPSVPRHTVLTAPRRRHPFTRLHSTSTFRHHKYTTQHLIIRGHIDHPRTFIFHARQPPSAKKFYDISRHSTPSQPSVTCYWTPRPSLIISQSGCYLHVLRLTSLGEKYSS